MYTWYDDASDLVKKLHRLKNQLHTVALFRRVTVTGAYFEVNACVRIHSGYLFVFILAYNRMRAVTQPMENIIKRTRINSKCQMLKVNKMQWLIHINYAGRVV